MMRCFCAEGVKCSTDWNALEVDQVYTAYSMKQAIKVLEENDVDIILTDVEMPKGTGLDLLEWVREQGMNPVSILLTSYAQFNYAKQAIELGVLEYLLKPIDSKLLYQVFEKAVSKVKEKHEYKKKFMSRLSIGVLPRKIDYVILAECSGAED